MDISIVFSCNLKISTCPPPLSHTQKLKLPGQTTILPKLTFYSKNVISFITYIHTTTETAVRLPSRLVHLHVLHNIHVRYCFQTHGTVPRIHKRLFPRLTRLDDVLHEVIRLYIVIKVCRRNAADIQKQILNKFSLAMKILP